MQMESCSKPHNCVKLFAVFRKHQVIEVSWNLQPKLVNDDFDHPRLKDSFTACSWLFLMISLCYDKKCFSI